MSCRGKRVLGWDVEIFWWALDEPVGSASSNLSPNNEIKIMDFQGSKDPAYDEEGEIVDSRPDHFQGLQA